MGASCSVGGAKVAPLPITMCTETEFEHYSTNQVAAWLEAIDLGKYAPAARKQAVNGNLLLKLYKKGKLHTVYEYLDLQGLQRHRLEEELEDLVEGKAATRAPPPPRDKPQPPQPQPAKKAEKKAAPTTKAEPARRQEPAASTSAAPFSKPIESAVRAIERAASRSSSEGGEEKRSKKKEAEEEAETGVAELEALEEGDPGNIATDAVDGYVAAAEDLEWTSSLADIDIGAFAQAIGPLANTAIDVLRGLSDVVAHAPFIAPIGAILKVALEVTKGVLANLDSCRRLLERLIWVGRLLVRADGGRKRAKNKKSPLVELFGQNNITFVQLKDIMERAKKQIQSFQGAKWYMKVLKQGSDRSSFDNLDRELAQKVEDLMKELAVENAFSATTDFASKGDEEKIKSFVEGKIAELAPGMSVQEYLEKLEKEGKAGDIEALLPPGDLALARSIKAGMKEDFEKIHKALDSAHNKLDDIGSNIAQLTQLVITAQTRLSSATDDKALAQLSEELRELFELYKDKSNDSIPWQRFLTAVQTLVPDLETRVELSVHAFGYDPTDGLILDDYLEVVLKSMLDEDQSGFISAPELYAFQSRCRGLAERAQRMNVTLTLGPEDKEMSLGYCISVSRQTFPATLLDPGRDVGLRDLRRLLRNPLNFKADLESHSVNYIEGTRLWLLDEVDSWLEAPDRRALLLVGGPGEGKSCFSAQLCLRRQSIIRAKVFARHDEAKRRDPAALLRTIAYQLAESVHGLWRPMLEAAKTLPGDADPFTIFSALLEGPCGVLGSSENNTADIVILIDALDEAEDHTGKNELADVLVKFLRRLPRWLRFIITSRPKSRAGDPMHEKLSAVFDPFQLGDDKRHRSDLQIVISKRLERIVADNKLLNAGTQTILEASGGSFAYVATLFSDILLPQAQANGGQLPAAALASDNVPPKIDGLYLASLEKRILAPGGNAALMKRMLRVLVVARESMLLDDFALILGFESSHNAEFLTAVKSLEPYFELQFFPLTGEQRIKAYHKSVIDFLTTLSRAGSRLFCEGAECEAELTDRLSEIALSSFSASDLRKPLMGYIARHALAHAISVRSTKVLEAMCAEPQFLYAQAVEKRLDLLLMECLLAPSELRPAGSLFADLTRWLPLADRTCLEAEPRLVYQSLLLLPTSSVLARTAEAKLASTRFAKLALDTADADEEEPVLREGFLLPRIRPEKFPARTAILRGFSSSQWSPCGNFILCEAVDNQAAICDARTHQRLQEFPHTDRVTHALYSPDGQRVVTCARDNTVNVWMASTGEKVWSGTHDDWPSSAAWSPDGSQVATGSDDKGIIVWDAQSGRTVYTITLHKETVSHLAFTPDGTRLVSGADDGAIGIIDTATGASVHLIEGELEDVYRFALHPSGKWLAVASNDLTLVISVESAEIVARLKDIDKEDESVSALCWSPAGDSLLIGCSTNVTLAYSFSAETRAASLVHQLKGHAGTIRSICFSPDGLTVATSSADTSVRIWDASTGRCLRELRSASSAGIKSAEYHPGDPSILLTTNAGDGTIALYTLKEERDSSSLVRTQKRAGASHDAAVKSWAWASSANHDMLVTGSNDGSCILWKRNAGGASTSAVAPSPSFNGTKTATVFPYGVRLLDKHPEGCSLSCVSLSPDGRTVIAGVGSDSETLKFISVPSDLLSVNPSAPLPSAIGVGPSDSHGEDNWADALGFTSTTGEAWSVGGDGFVANFKFSSSAVERTSHQKSHKDMDNAIVSPSGRFLIASGGNGKTPTLWDVSTSPATKLHVLKEGVRKDTTAFFFNRDESRVAVCQEDCTVIIFDTASGEVAVSISPIMFVEEYAPKKEPKEAPPPAASGSGSDDDDESEEEEEEDYSIGALDWSPDGEHVAFSFGISRDKGSFYVFETMFGLFERRVHFEGDSGIRFLRYTPDGKHLVAVHDGSDETCIRVWRTSDFKCVWTVKGGISGAEWRGERDDKLLVESLLDALSSGAETAGLVSLRVDGRFVLSETDLFVL